MANSLVAVQAILEHEWQTLGILQHRLFREYNIRTSEIDLRKTLATIPNVLIQNSQARLQAHA